MFIFQTTKKYPALLVLQLRRGIRKKILMKCSEKQMRHCISLRDMKKVVICCGKMFRNYFTRIDFLYIIAKEKKMRKIRDCYET